MIVWALPALYLIFYFWGIRRNLSIRWFVLGTLSAVIWVLVLGIVPFVSNESIARFLIYRVRTVGMAASVFIFLFILEYSVGRTLSRKTVLGFAVVPIFTVGVVWINPSAFMDVQLSPGGFYSLSFNQVGLVHVMYAVVLHVMSFGLLLRELLTTSGTQRKQIAIILAGYVVGLTPVFLPAFGLLPNYFNPGVIGIGLLLLIAAYGLDRYGLFVTSPMDKDAVFREIEDGVVILNEDDNVTDMNRLARELFDVGETFIGLSADDVFAGHPDLRAAIGDWEQAGTITASIDGAERHFSLNVTPLRYGRGLTGTILVLRDVTPVKEREQELDMLRQVFSRLFRHNVRNELSIARGYMGMVRDEADDETITDNSETAIQSVDRFLGHVEKARDIESLIETDQPPFEQSLPSLVSAAIATYEGPDPDPAITTDVDDVTVLALEGFSTVIENAIENAVLHNPPSVPIRIASDVGDDAVTLVIEDGGDGIPESETSSVIDGEETAMSHGSGVGLWLMKWYVANSNGDLDIENTGQGTRVLITLPRPAPDADPDS